MSLSKREFGNEGEDIASKFIKKKGIKILERNFYSRWGEVDIIGYDSKEKEYVFFEVRMRENEDFGKPYELITKTKLKKVYKTGMVYLLKNDLENEVYRIDVISILFKDFEYYEIEHFENVEK